MNFTALSRLSEPLKSAAIKAASGESLDAIKALDILLTDSSADSRRLLVQILVPVALAGIPLNYPSSLSGNPGLPIGEEIMSAAISLHTLALLLMSSEHKTIPKLNRLLKTRYASLFGWMLFIQRHLYLPGADFFEHYGDQPDILALKTPETLVGLLCFIKECGAREGMEVFQDDLLRSCVCELWRRLIPGDLDGSHCLIREIVSLIVSMLVMDDHHAGVTRFIDKCLGPVVFVELMLADLEMTHQQAKADRGRSPDVYDCFLQSMCTILGALGSRSFYQLSADIPVPMLIRRLTAMVKWTLKDRQRRIEERPSDEEALQKIDGIVVMYCQFIFWCPATQDRLPWLDVLQSGIIKTLRFKVPSYKYIPQDDPEAAEWTQRTCLALMSLSIHLPAVLRYTKRLYSPSPVPSLMSWGKLNSALQIQLKNEEIYRKIGSTFDQCATCKSKPEDALLRVCSGCQVVKYCSTACQRQDRSDHRSTCGLLHLSGSAHPFIRLNNAKGLIMLAYQESAFRHRAGFSSIASKGISTHCARHPDKIPVVHYTTHASSRRISVKSQSDFPDIFNAHAFRDPAFLPKFKDLYLASNGGRECLPHFVVISLVLNPTMDHTLDVLSSLETLALCGILEREHWDEPPPSSVWFDLWELRYNSKADDES